MGVGGWVGGRDWVRPLYAGRSPFSAAAGAGGRHTCGEAQSPVTAISHDTSPP